MEVMIILVIAGLIFVGGIALLTALINSVLVALGLSAISWWTVILILAVLRVIKWFIS